MKRLPRLRKNLLAPANAGLAALSAIISVLAFPDFDLWFLAWAALVPLFFAVEREKDAVVKSFLVGWVYGLVFFFGSCWWLTFAPITYAGIPWPITYFFLFCAASVVGILPGIFGALLSVLLKRFGSYAIFSAPFLWTAVEYLRMWLTGNNWNAIGYSQAFQPPFLSTAALGGVYLTGFLIVVVNAVIAFKWLSKVNQIKSSPVFSLALWLPALLAVLGPVILSASKTAEVKSGSSAGTQIVAVQPNVPMSGLTYQKYQRLLERHLELAEAALKPHRENSSAQTAPLKTIVVFPESPMIFQYGRDSELREYLGDFARRNNSAVLFNSAETAGDGNQILNSAVMIDESGEKIAQYDKIHLVPFGEYMPFPEPLASRLPAFVGNFQFGGEYDLLQFGEAAGGVMICFESHFGGLSREYARRGADILVEMTNDGYLGKTPVLRQHLANSVFRAAETARPLFRVTNVGVTAYVSERGEVSDAADVYAEATRVWPVNKSDGRRTIYVEYGDWFAWACWLIVLLLLGLGLRKSGGEK